MIFCFKLKKKKIDSSNKSYIRLETQMGTFYNSGKQKSISATVESQTLKSKRTSGHCISETGPEKTGERPGKVFFSIYKPDWETFYTKNPNLSGKNQHANKHPQDQASQ